MRNFIFYTLTLSLVILMAACKPTPTPIATVVSDCGWDGTAVSWLDANGNGVWDNNEFPLTNVEFYVDGWTDWYIDNAFVSKNVSTGGVGIVVWLAGCPDVSFQVCAKVLENYRPTTKVCMIPKQNLKRYAVMQEFLRTGKKFGSQRKASEKLAVSIGMQNLARTASCYTDPQRLEWVMEVEAVADLAQGPIRLELDQYTVTLSINELGEPALDFRKKDKPIKTLPSAVKKNERVAEVLERKQQLDRQVSRMRLSLEQSMCRGDEFEVSEIKTLFRPPMLKAMIEQLVFVSAYGLGYPVHAGASLCDHQDRQISLKDSDLVRIAHPLDLLESKQWHLWQHECFIAERVQPFKQVFRELYVLTLNERDEGNLSRRYAGQQVNPRQALALFGQRGWVVDPNEGVQKTFHQEGISARVGFLQGAFTPAEAELCISSQVVPSVLSRFILNIAGVSSCRLQIMIRRQPKLFQK